MSGVHEKTSVTRLQELSAKINPKDLPVYTELDKAPEEHTNTCMKFFYRCNALGISSVGGGVTKKIAKHNAAELLLMKRQCNIDGLFDDEESQPKTFESQGTSELMDYCTLKNFHKPEFKLISQFGPSHDPTFTVECKLDSIRRSATAGNKQQAKKMAASEVLKIIKSSFPDLEKKLAIVNDQKTAPETIREKIESYLQLKKKGKDDSMGTTIKDRNNFFQIQDEEFTNALKNILKATDISEEEKFENLKKELETMWPCQIDKFVDTDLVQFELLIDYEKFTCVIVATEEQLKKEVLQYFNEMLDLNDQESWQCNEEFIPEIVLKSL